MPLADANVPRSPAWWMTILARRMLNRQRMMRLATLSAYRSACPPMMTATESQRRAFYAFNRVSRSNFARPIVRAPAERMSVRAIRTAAVDDPNGDSVAWRYWTGSGLDIASPDVHSDMLTFNEGYVRVAVDAGDRPVALRRDPRFTITAHDPLNPSTVIAGFELVWDDLAGMDYAYLWLPGEQYVASRRRTARPAYFTIPGTELGARRWPLNDPYPRLTFNADGFDMRPHVDDVPEADRDGGPYCESYSQQVVPLVRFENRDGVGEFEEHLDLLDRINYTVMLRVVTAAVQAYKQRALEQSADGTDRMPKKDPNTGEDINWDEVFMPGPDALWKLPPGVKIWESAEVQLQPILSAVEDDVKHLSAVTNTPFSLFSPDGVNQSAEGAQANREGLTFKVEDRDRIAGRRWAQVLSLMFQFAPDEDRYGAGAGQGVDRADAGSIIVDWAPAERYSLAEKAQADSQNKSLSNDMAAAKIWGLTPDEVQINSSQRAKDALITAAGGATPKDAGAAG